MVPSRVQTRSINSSSGAGSRERCACSSKIGRTACISGSSQRPWRAASSWARNAPASSVESGIRPPIQRGTAARRPLARRTQAVLSRSRTNSSSRPPNKKHSPGFSQLTNDSSTVPSLPPLRYCTVIADSPTIVPIERRWRCAVA